MERKKITCIECPLGCSIEVGMADSGITIEGNRCKRGKQYVLSEISDPKRIVTSTMRVNNGTRPLVSIKTDKEISKNMIFDLINFINNVKINAPVKIGDILVENIFGTSVNIIATSNN